MNQKIGPSLNIASDETSSLAQQHDYRILTGRIGEASMETCFFIISFFFFWDTLINHWVSELGTKITAQIQTDGPNNALYLKLLKNWFIDLHKAPVLKAKG